MRLDFRQIVGLICLVALVCGGQASACMCDLAPPAVECGAHEHGDKSGEEHDHSEPGDGVQCPCATCHSCTHMPVALSGATLPFLKTPGVVSRQTESPRLLVRSGEIFIPPKLG